MKSDFKHAVFYEGEHLASCKTAEEAAAFHAALHSHEEEIEIAPPPPPMVGESGIPEALFERGQSEMFSLTKVVEIPTVEAFQEITRDWEILSKDKVGGKVLFTIRRRG